jgi:hypothetical protein
MATAGRCRDVAGEGLAADVNDYKEAWIVRGSDGKGWRIAAEPNEYLVKVFWIDSEEIWLSTAPVVPGFEPEQGLLESNIMIIRRDSLGPATDCPQ